VAGEVFPLHECYHCGEPKPPWRGGGIEKGYTVTDGREYIVAGVNVTR
jgi:hypothetical protein